MKTIIIIIITIFFSSGICYFLMKWKNKKRIDEILNMIENLNKKDYKTPMKQDDYSILEDEIYKLFLQIVEERERTKELSIEQIKNLEDIAHQIKTPITSILFSLELLEDKNNEIDNIKKQIIRLNRLTEILLKLSSLEANIHNMKNEEININELLEYAIDILEGYIIDNNINIKMDIENKIIVGDFYWLSEAIINILRNSIEKSVDKNIKIDLNSNPIYEELIIEDEGGGIEEKHIKEIFKRFYKSSDSKGFGIGLSMAKTIIEKNNGEIIVKNGEKGAIFSIKFYNVT